MEFVIRPTIRREAAVLFISAMIIFGAIYLAPVAPEVKYPVAAAVLVLSVGLLLYYHIKGSNEYLKVDSNGVEYKKGLLLTKKMSIGFDRIQEISLQRGVVETILGLTAISIDTAGTSDVEVYDDRFDAKDAEDFLAEVNKYTTQKKRRKGKGG